jgi:hypothetical protein
MLRLLDDGVVIGARAIFSTSLIAFTAFKDEEKPHSA